MTYRQLFDEALGEPPPPNVDIDAVVAREHRRSRRRRFGAYASTATAVLALALGAGAVVGPDPAGGPAPTSDVAATGVDDRERLRTAMLAAIAREAPDLRWVEGADPVTDQSRWDGPLTDTPEWAVREYEWVSMTGWFGVGVAARDDVRSYLAVNVGRLRKGQTAGPYGCDPDMVACRAFSGPGGERVVGFDVQGYRRPPSQPPVPLVIRFLDVQRPDGTRVSLQAMSSSDRHLLTIDEMAAIALDPAIALPNR